MPTPEIIENSIYSTEDLSNLFDIPYQSMRLLIKRGHIKGAKIGKNWFVSGRSLLKVFEDDTLSSETDENRMEIEREGLNDDNFEG